MLSGWPRRPCSWASTAVLSRRARGPLQGARAAGPRGTETKFPGAAFNRTPAGSVRVVPEEGAFLEQLGLREVGPAKMIQAILVFNNHGKPRLVRFYQRFVSAARPVTPLRAPEPSLSHGPQERSAAPPAPAPCMTHPPATPSSFLVSAFLCFVTLFLGS